MAPPRSRAASTILAAVIAHAACQRPADEGTTTATSSSTSSPTLPEPPKFDRVVAPTMPAFGAQPGWIEGGVAFAAIRAQPSIAFLRSLPLPADVARDVAEAGVELGVDLRAEDLERRFALAPDAIVSMTLARPVGPRTDDLRAGLARGGALLDAIAQELKEREHTDDTAPPEVVPPEVPPEVPATPTPPEPATPPAAPPPPVAPPKETKAKPVKPAKPAKGKKVAPPEIVEVVPIVPPIEPSVEPPTVVAPPPIDPALRIEATKLVESAVGLGLHFRVNVPVTDPEPILRELDRLARRESSRRWAEVCRTIAQARVCGGDSRMVVVVTAPRGHVQFDVIGFAMPASPLAGDRPATVRAAVEARTAEHPALAELGGTAAAWLDAAAIARFHEAERIQSELNQLRWSSAPPSSEIRERLQGIDVVDRMSQGNVLFEGLQLELLAADDRLHAVARWHARAATRELAAELLDDRPTHATVPTHAALCDGALFCARSGSLPDPIKLSDRLATGIWAQEERALEREIDIDEPGPALHLLAASWPNLLAAVARWPLAEAGDGMEAAMVRNGVDAVARIEGFGLSVRSLTVTRNRAQSDYAAYARTTAVDNAMIRGLLGFAEIRLQESTLTGVDGPVQFATLPEDDFPLVLSTYDERTPIAVDGKDVAFGWLAMVDGNDRMAWLLGLPRELSTGPRLYVEVPDIGRVFASVGEIDRELEVLRGWLERRRFAAALFIERGEPRIVATLGPG